MNGYKKEPFVHVQSIALKQIKLFYLFVIIDNARSVSFAFSAIIRV
ncbi:MAG: hypothetical protein LBB88_07360 [Planctomycetaceae bacterium]|nr:hypothetical protein [Planctomycetaceae bacterium]